MDSFFYSGSLLVHETQAQQSMESRRIHAAKLSADIPERARDTVSTDTIERETRTMLTQAQQNFLIAIETYERNTYDECVSSFAVLAVADLVSESDRYQSNQIEFIAPFLTDHVVAICEHIRQLLDTDEEAIEVQIADITERFTYMLSDVISYVVSVELTERLSPEAI